MQNKQLLQILTDLGLSENESKVYMTSLSLGPASILSIARGSEVRRTTVYPVIDSLKNKGLMRTEVKGFKKLFTAEHPKNLQGMLVSKKYALEEYMPDFLSMYNLKGDESSIKFYEGLQSIQQLYLDTLSDVVGKDDYLVITNQDQWYHLNEEFSVRYIEARAKKRINTRLLFTDSEIAQKHKQYEQNFHEKIKILPKETELDTDLLITPKRLVIFQTKLPYTAIEIQAPSAIKMQKNLFEIIWHSIN
jgi:sugar-specific transcriptional regulator TrmB